MTDGSTIQGAARALCIAAGEDPDRLVYVGRIQVPLWDTRVPEVRAVIGAIRQPSFAMLDAGTTAIESAPDDADDIFLAEVVWPAMIDQLLDDGNAATDGVQDDLASPRPMIVQNVTFQSGRTNFIPPKWFTSGGTRQIQSFGDDALGARWSRSIDVPKD